MEELTLNFVNLYQLKSISNIRINHIHKRCQI